MLIVASDNGASGEGGYHGTFNENIFFNAGVDSVAQNLEHLDDLGGVDSYGHYATGWTMAGNTPFRRWKRNVHNGGVADPLIISHPAGNATGGELRHHYVHAIDVVPTVLDLLGVEMPEMLGGVPQEELHGTSFRATIDDPAAPEVRTSQYYEMYGSRAMYCDGWKAVTFHAVPGIPADGDGNPAAPFREDRWELYHVAEDPSETHDLAAAHPEKLQELIGLWYVAAGRYDVLPLHAAQMKGQRPSPIPERSSYTYWPGTTSIDSEAAVNERMRPFTVVAPVAVPAAGAEGVLIAQGGQFGGWTLSSTPAAWSTSTTTWRSTATGSPPSVCSSPVAKRSGCSLRSPATSRSRRSSRRWTAPRQGDRRAVTDPLARRAPRPALQADQLAHAHAGPGLKSGCNLFPKSASHDIGAGAFRASCGPNTARAIVRKRTPASRWSVDRLQTAISGYSRRSDRPTCYTRTDIPAHRTCRSVRRLGLRQSLWYQQHLWYPLRRLHLGPPVVLRDLVVHVVLVHLERLAVRRDPWRPRPLLGRCARTPCCSRLSLRRLRRGQ